MATKLNIESSSIEIKTTIRVVLKEVTPGHGVKVSTADGGQILSFFLTFADPSQEPDGSQIGRTFYLSPTGDFTLIPEESKATETTTKKKTGMKNYMPLR